MPTASVPPTISPRETLSLPAPTYTPIPSPSPTYLQLPAAVPESTPAPPDLTVGDCPADGLLRPCPQDHAGWLQRFSAPPGFAIEFVAGLPEGQLPTTMTYNQAGELFVATVPDPFADDARRGTIWKLAGASFEPIAAGMLMPAGLAFHPQTGDLYVSHRASDEEGQLSRIPVGEATLEPVVTGLPCCYTLNEHQPNGIVFGPDGDLYMGIGARSDHGPDPDAPNLPASLHPLEAGILRISPDGARVEKFADGFRNPYDLAFDSQGQLWAVDNGPDFGPPERVHLVEAGGHYGFPYYADCAVCATPPPGLEIAAPFGEFAAHATPTGIVANTGMQFPANYFDNLFVTLWNPWATPGLWRLQPGGAIEPFVLGLFSPVDVVLAPDGSLVVADFFFGHIFRIRWVGLP